MRTTQPGCSREPRSSACQHANVRLRPDQVVSDRSNSRPCRTYTVAVPMALEGEPAGTGVTDVDQRADLGDRPALEYAVARAADTPKHEPAATRGEPGAEPAAAGRLARGVV